MSRDDAADVMQKHKVHHIVVSPGGSGKFTGLLSSWDIARECALDAKAWPYNRSAWRKYDGASTDGA